MATIDVLRTYLDDVTVDLMIEEYGGSCLRVPGKESGKSWNRLEAALGHDRAATVVKCFQGDSIAVPMAVDEKTAETIRNLRQSGTPVAEIAKLGFVRRFSERHIYRICEPKAA